MARKRDDDCDIIDSLRDDGYSTEAIERAIARLEKKPSPRRVEGLLAAWLKTPLSGDPEGMQEVTNFATFLILASGYGAAQEACLSALLKLDARPTGTDSMALFMLAEQLDLEPSDAPPDLALPYAQLAAGFAADMGARAEDLPLLAETLLCVPATLRPRLVHHLIEALKSSPFGGTFAALAMLYPLGEASHRELLGPLMASGEAGREFLEKLQPEDCGSPGLRLLAKLPPAAQALKPPNPKHLPLDWPVTSCFATVPDGRGSQAIYLFRRRPDRSFIMTGAVINDGRGIVDGLGHLDMRASEQKAMVARLTEDAPGTTEVPLGYAIARIREGIALSKEKRLPLPFDFQIDRYLLAGLWGEPSIDAARRSARLAGNPALTRTDELLVDPACRSHFLVNDGTHRTAGFFEEILPQMRRQPVIEGDLLVRWAGVIFDDPAQRLWKGRLEQLAYLFDLKKDAHKAMLAATAARAIDPQSGIPLSEQPWAIELLVKSSVIAMGAEDERPAPAAGPKEPPKLSEALMVFAEPVLAGMPPRTTARQLQAKLKTLADLWNLTVTHEIALEKGMPSELEALLNPQEASMDALMNASLLKFLMDRKRMVFPHDRRLIKQVAVTGRTPADFKIQVVGTAEPPSPAGPAPEMRYYQLKIGLRGTTPPIWRRVLVPAGMKLSDLHLVIQGALGWHNYHMHSFTIRGMEFGPPSEWMDDVEDERKFRLDQVALPGESFRYLYDFGDSWAHTIKVEKAFASIPEGPVPRCIGGKRAAPPEDCGGVWGFHDRLEALKDPEDPDHEEALEVLGGDYDPAAFSPAQAQARIDRFVEPERKPKRKTKR